MLLVDFWLCDSAYLKRSHGATTTRYQIQMLQFHSILLQYNANILTEFPLLFFYFRQDKNKNVIIYTIYFYLPTQDKNMNSSKNRQR